MSLHFLKLSRSSESWRAQAKGIKKAASHIDVLDTTPKEKRPKLSHEENTSSSKGKKVQGKGKKQAPPFKFRGHDLRALGVPEEAWPEPTRIHTGKHGYTVKNEGGAATRRHTAFNCRTRSGH